MEIYATTLVGMVGRRFIRDNKQDLAELLNLNKNDLHVISFIKSALRTEEKVKRLRAKLQLPKKASLQEVADAVKTHVQHRKDMRAWNIKPNSNEDDELDELNRAIYMAALNH